MRKGKEGKKRGRKEGKEGGREEIDSLSSERSITLVAPPRIGFVFLKKVGAQKSNERQ